MAPPGDACRAVCPVNAPLANRLFYIHDLGHRCIDVGSPASWTQGIPVLINACNGTAAQQIRVKEIDSSHDVGLSVDRQIPIATVSASATGIVAPPVAVGFCLGVHGGAVTPGAALELQVCNALSPAQRFALDGDAILIGSQSEAKVARDFVVERQNGSTVQQTPLVVAKHDLWEVEPLRIDARYFRFNAVDGSGSAPTSGFLTVSDETHLVCAARCGWGTVVQIDDHDPLELTSLPSPGIGIADGTTIRGYRSSTYQGPEIRTCVLAPDQGEWAAFAITGHAVRVTGLRLHGPNADSRCGKDIENHSSDENGISVAPGSNPSTPSAWLDRLDVSNWPGSGIRIDGGDPTSTPGTVYPYQPFASVVANLIHDNTYGSNTQNSAFMQNRANIFYSHENQPVVSRIMGCGGGYAAMDNLFLTESSHISSDDVDMHGSLNPGHWNGGKAGDYFDVGSNTFLLKDKDNFVANVNQRGASCRFTNIHDNVFVRSATGAIHDPYPPAPTEYANTFNAQDPTQGMLLPVGDFDGDRIDDVLLATGAAWYYSSGGQTEWRYLNRMPERASALLLGDFDGDGRTDVATLHGSNIDISWAGVSTWQTINVTAWPVSDLAVGDFDGDGRADLFLATGTQWFLASGGRNWVPFSGFSDAMSNLRFGHFTDKTKMQILRAHNHRWEVTEWGMASWTDIGEATTDSVAGLVAGDFNGDGFTDLARSITHPLPVPPPSPGSFLPYDWQYTSPGHGSSWTGFGTYSTPMAAILSFDGEPVTRVILWVNDKFYYSRGGALQPLSRQPMR